MFQIAIWSDTARKEEIRQLLVQVDDIRICENVKQCDVLLVDIAASAFPLSLILPDLQALHQHVILVMLASDSTQLLDVIGLHVFQFILHEQLTERLLDCMEHIQEYLMNISSICIHVDREKQFVRIKDILYIRIEETFVYLGLQKKELATQFTSLEKIKEQLGDDFQYANRNVIVNTRYISSISETQVWIQSLSFSLSRRRKKQLVACCSKRRWQE